MFLGVRHALLHSHSGLEPPPSLSDCQTHFQDQFAASHSVCVWRPTLSFKGNRSCGFVFVSPPLTPSHPLPNTSHAPPPPTHPNILAWLLFISKHFGRSRYSATMVFCLYRLRQCLKTFLLFGSCLCLCSVCIVVYLCVVKIETRFFSEINTKFITIF